MIQRNDLRFRHLGPYADAWRFALPALVVSLLSILTIYRETAWSMVEIWSRSETFTHGFLVPPISLWLIWSRRDQLVRLTPRPSTWAMLLFLGAGFFWLLGEIAAAGVVSQFALTSLLVLAVPALLGWSVARCIAFPLAFLFFAVPFGEFAMPKLMEWTAEFTVLGLRLSGVPVFQEGLHFVIPSGAWSVVEACSGVRYLIASLTVGTLFAYLSYRSLKRRLIFVGVAFLVPVVANWLRAYMIVMIGHLSGNKLATGVDHLVYGWLFFGVVIMIMFWIGSRWREDDLPAHRPDRHAIKGDALRARDVASVPVLLAGLAVMALAVIWPLAQWQIERHAKPQIDQMASMELVADWSETPESITDWRPKFDDSSASMDRVFVSKGQKVGLYLGYYRNQGDNKKMVTTTNILVSGGDQRWAKMAEDSRQISMAGAPVTVRRAEIRLADSSRLIAWQWYWVNGYFTASDLKAKALTALSRLLGQGDDSAVVVIYAPEADQGAPDASLEAFVQAAGPEIERVLARTRDKR